MVREKDFNPISEYQTYALGELIEKYKDKPTDSELATVLFQKIWAQRQEVLKNAGIDLDLSVPPCAYSQDELRKENARVGYAVGRRLGYLPQQLASEEARPLLAKIWPEMRNDIVSKTINVRVGNEESRFGWFDYDSAIVVTPHPDTTVNELRDIFKSQKRVGMNLSEYIIAAQDSKLIDGRYLDQQAGWSRLLGSIGSNGKIAKACFLSDGHLNVFLDLESGERKLNVGARSVGLPQR